MYYGTDNMTLVNSTEMLGPANVSDMYTVTISGLMPFTTYYYVVSAENSEGTTNSSVMIFMTNETGIEIVIDTAYVYLFCTCLAPSIAPRNFRVIDVTTTNITFQWDPLTGQGTNGIVRSYTVTCISGGSPLIMVSISNS